MELRGAFYLFTYLFIYLFIYLFFKRVWAPRTGQTGLCKQCVRARQNNPTALALRSMNGTWLRRYPTQPNLNELDLT